MFNSIRDADPVKSENNHWHLDTECFLFALFMQNDAHPEGRRFWGLAEMEWKVKREGRKERGKEE